MTAKPIPPAHVWQQIMVELHKASGGTYILPTKRW